MIPPPQGVTLTELKEAEKAIGRIGEEQPIREGERREEQPPESTVGGGAGGRDGFGGGGSKGNFGGITAVGRVVSDEYYGMSVVGSWGFLGGGGLGLGVSLTSSPP